MAVPLLQAELLLQAGFSHGFTQRLGGVSAPPLDSLNLGRVQGDDPEAVERNHARLAETLGYTQLFEVSQVHGADVLCAPSSEVPRAFRKQEADALVGTQSGQAVGVRVADCLPLLVGDPETGHVAAVHAGWRGAAAGVVARALRALGDASVARRLLCAIGPHIGPCCFEVSEEVAAQIAAASPDPRGVVVPRDPRPHVDLSRLVQSQLVAAGVAEARIERVPGCTRCDSKRFYSYRRDGKASGRHLAVIVAGC